MTSDIAPLTFPTSDWEGWLAARTDDQLQETRRLLDEVKQADADRDAAATLALWNDLNLALRNAFAVASVLSNMHPDEAVRTRGEQVEQDASRLLTEIELDRDLYDVLAALDVTGLDEQARRVHALTVRDFRRAGVDQDDDVRARLRELAERETAVGQEFSKNIRDGVRSVSLDPSALDGLPADFVESHPAGEDGKVVVTTEYPDFIPFVTFSRDREARAALMTRVPEPRLARERRAAPRAPRAAPRARPAARVRRLAGVRRRGQDDRQGLGHPGVRRPDRRRRRAARARRPRAAAAPGAAGPPGGAGGQPGRQGLLRRGAPPRGARRRRPAGARPTSTSPRSAPGCST